MITPTFIKQQIVDLKTGEPTSVMQQFMDTLMQQLQANFSNDGMVIPKQTTANIQYISDPSNPNGLGVGTVWYDTTLNKFVGNENGTLVSFNTTPI